MPLDPQLEGQLFDTIYDSLQDGAAKLTSLYVPQWNARNDISRTLLTISSAILVVSISLSSHVTTQKWILGVCWGAFLGAIVSAVLALYFCGGLLTLPAHIVGARKELKEAVRNFDVTKPHEEAESLVDNLITEKLNHMEKLDRRAIRLLQTSLLLFLVGVSLPW